MPVDVVGAHDRELDPLARLVAQGGLRAAFVPGCRNDEADVDAGVDQRPLACSVRSGASGVVDADDTHQQLSNRGISGRA
jgi:hypothetical protein